MAKRPLEDELLKKGKRRKIESIEQKIDKLPTLVDIAEIQKKKKLEKTYLDEKDLEEQELYSFEEDDSSYLIRVSLHIDKMADARLLSIKEGEKTIFMNRSMGRNVYIKFTLESHTIEIVWVTMRDIPNMCTRSVAYTMKALLHYINKKNMFAPTGKVKILSRNADRAFHCYNRAFLLNGYTINNEEYIRFRIAFRGQQEYNISTGKDYNVNFTFEKYINNTQRASLDTLSKSKPPGLKF